MEGEETREHAVTANFDEGEGQYRVDVQATVSCGAE